VIETRHNDHRRRMDSVSHLMGIVVVRDLYTHYIVWVLSHHLEEVAILDGVVLFQLSLDVAGGR